MNILILGPGSVGSLWAYNLKQAGHNVSLWGLTNETSREIQLDDLPSITFKNRDVEALAAADVVLVTVKAWQVERALEAIADDIHPDTILLLMHNGMGTSELVEKRLPDNPLLLATTTHGAYKPSHEQVLHTGVGHTQIGGANDKGKQCSFIAEVLDKALAKVAWNDDILQALWTKLAVNCAINPLTAIHQFKNGELGQPEFHHQLSDIVDELISVMKAEAIEADKETLFNAVMQVVEATAKNFSSMHQDVFHQRKTEIDFITGHLIRTANKHGIETPANAALYNQIQQLEKDWN